jgi:ubiquinone/menaquinone biosynthesis C-methylase UbiE
MGTPNGGSNRTTADFYDSERWIRFRFWEKVFWFLAGGEEQGRREVMKHFPDLSGTRLLEVGIGDGANLKFLPPNCEVYGNDISMAQLTTCHDQNKAHRVRLFLCQAEVLPFRDAIFDHLLSVGGFNYFSDPARSLREMARVVRPGGMVVVADETPGIGKLMFKFRLGRRILERMLGREFTDLVERGLDMKLKPIVGNLLENAKIHRIWRKLGYCIVGRAPAR